LRSKGPLPRNRVIRVLSIGPRLILRQLRSDLTVVVALVAVILAATAVLAAIPLLFNRMADDGLRHALDEADPPARNVTVSRDSRIFAAPTGPVFANVSRAGETFQKDEVPATLQALISEQLLLVDSPRFTVEAFPEEPSWPFPVFMRFRHQQDIADHVELVAGRLPQPREPILVPLPPTEDPVEAEDGESEDTERGDQEEAPTHELLPLYEVAVTPATLEDLEVGLGGRMILRPDTSDVPFREVPRSQLGYRLVLEVSGLIEPTVADEEYWFQDLQLHRPHIIENPDFRLIFIAGLMAPADYERLLRDAGAVAWHYEWRYFIDPAGVDAGSVTDLAGDVRNLEFAYPGTEVFRRGRDAVATGLTGVFDSYFDQRNSTVAILALVSLGVFVVTLATVALLAALVAARQSASLYLLRSRGASRAQLVMSRAAEGLLISIPSCAVGVALARRLVEARQSSLSSSVAAAVAIAATGLILVAALSAIRNDLGTLNSAEERRQPSLRRKVSEALIVVVALTAAVLLRRRGLDAEPNSAEGAVFDPLLAAAPSLLAVAAAIVTLRLYAYPIRFFAWLAAKRRGVVAFVGLRRILQQPASARLPLLVVVLAVAVALFSGTVRSSIEEGQLRSSWNAVGADVRISGAVDTAALVRDLDLSAVDSIEATAAARLVDTFSRSDAGSTAVEFLALDVADYAAVVAGTRADPNLPASMIAASDGKPTGDADDAIPAIVQRSWMESRGLGVGDEFDLTVGARVLAFSVAAPREAFPSLTVGIPFVVADRESVRAAGGGELLPSLIYVRAPQDALVRIRRTVADQAPASTVSAQQAQLESVRAAPFVAGVLDGFRLTFRLTLLFGLVAVVAAFLLTSRPRARDHGYLRALGLSRRRAMAATIVEQVPPVIVATLAGSALGIGIAVLFAPGIDLAAFTGGDLAVGLLPDGRGALTVVSALLVGSGLAVVSSDWMAGRVNLGEVLRLGER